MSRKTLWAGLAVLALCTFLGRAAAATADRPSASPSLLELGKRIYGEKCAVCHGDDGDGAATVAERLYPPPRDFTRGEYRLVSTWEGIATDDDLFLTISRGMPGTVMPPWDGLPEETRWALVDYLRSLSRRPLQVAPQELPAQFGEPGSGEIVVPRRPEANDRLRGRARLLYGEACAPCHGATGRGDGKLQQRDSLGRPTWPRDLALGIFKGGSTPEEIYKRVVLGLPGSPMPSNPFFHGDDGWALTELILAIAEEDRHPWSLPATDAVVATAVDTLPVDSASAAWLGVPSVEIPLMPLYARQGRPPVVKLGACHEQETVAVSVAWTGARSASVEFSTETAPAYLAAKGVETRGRCDDEACRAFFSESPDVGAGDGLKILVTLWDGEPPREVAMSVWTELLIRPGS